MAMKKRPVKAENTVRQAGDDTVIYKVMLALGVCCVLILGLHLANRYYVMPNYFTPVRAVMLWVFRAAALLALADAVCWIAMRKKSAFFRRAGAPVFWILLEIALSGLVSYGYWVDAAGELYFLFIASTVLYLIYLLYQREFFLISLLTILSGACFFLLSKLYDGAGSFRPIVVNAVLAVVLILSGLVCWKAGKKDGCLVWGKKKWHLFNPGFSPLFPLVTCAVWLVCLIAAALLGSVFAYYCMFAAVAYELVAACYYTVKLS